MLVWQGRAVRAGARGIKRLCVTSSSPTPPSLPPKRRGSGADGGEHCLEELVGVFRAGADRRGAERPSMATQASMRGRGVTLQLPNASTERQRGRLSAWAAAPYAPNYSAERRCSRRVQRRISLACPRSSTSAVPRSCRHGSVATEGVNSRFGVAAPYRALCAA